MGALYIWYIDIDDYWAVLNRLTVKLRIENRIRIPKQKHKVLEQWKKKYNKKPK